MRKALYDLYRNDEILADFEMNRFTIDFETHHQQAGTATGYQVCTERMKSKFGMYTFDDRCRVIPGQLSPASDFVELKSLLLDQDLEKMPEL